MTMAKRHDAQWRLVQIMLDNYCIYLRGQAAQSQASEAAAALAAITSSLKLLVLTMRRDQAEHHIETTINIIANDIQRLKKERQTLAQHADEAAAAEDEVDEDVDRCAETGQEIDRLQNLADSIAAVREQFVLLRKWQEDNLVAGGCIAGTRRLGDSVNELEMNRTVDFGEHGKLLPLHAVALPFLSIPRNTTSEVDMGLATSESEFCHNFANHQELKLRFHVMYVVSSTYR